MIHLTEVGRMSYPCFEIWGQEPIVRSTLWAIWLLVPDPFLKAEGMDSSHHRLSDKVNCDLTLRRISVLLPFGHGVSIVTVSNISVVSSFLVP